MLDLESAIKHAEEVAEEQDMKAGFETDYQAYTMSEMERQRCRECASEHRQLAEWLTELKMLKEFMKEDFGTLCICALRYCHGRRTYMPSLVQDIVRNHFDSLSEKDLNVILEDEEFQSHMELFGDDCDKLDWQRFYGDLKAYMEEK